MQNIKRENECFHPIQVKTEEIVMLMKMLPSWACCLFLLLLLLLVDPAHTGRVLMKLKQRARELQLLRAKEHLLTAGRTHHVRGGFLHQQLDHFSRQGVRTFAQRYIVNEAFWRRPDGPVFLYVGGEGPLSEFDVLAGHHVNMAEEHGALLLALEHRFYGDSINPDGLQTEKLADLSSQQALVDLAVFHQHISQNFNLSSRNSWISFGGSYAGALSAWFRGKFPHLVLGAVASSAPVQARLDFSSYNNIVALSLRNEAIGGSEKCLGAVRRAFAAVEAALMEGNVSRVAADFGCCQTPENHDDQVELMQSLAGIFMGAVQYNEEGVFMSVGELCDVMTQRGVSLAERRPYDLLVTLAQIYRSTTEEACLDVSHEKMVKELMNTSLRSGCRTERQWIYQTCSEFGFYQTCEDASCPFSGMLTLQAHTKLCPVLFGISQHSLPANIAFTNNFYGGNDSHTHRVLYINGGVDPWHDLSVVRSGAEDEGGTVFIEDTAHCADMMSRGGAEPHSLQRARREIEERVASWLKTADREKMRKISSLSGDI